MLNSEVKNILKDEDCFKIIQIKLQLESMNHYNVVNYEIIPLSAANGYMGQYFTLR